MKKLSILLIGLLLVAGLAVADGHIAVSGSASVTFGVDLESGYTGFANAGTSSVTLTLIEKGSGTTGGDDGLYGEITLKDWEFKIASTDSVATETYASGSVSAKIVVDPATITIYSAPSFSMDEAATIDSGTVEGDISTSIANVNGSSVNGITISVPAGPATVAIKVASDGDWLENSANEYVIGSDIDLAVGPATVDLGVVYGWFGAAQLGLSAGVALDLSPLKVDLGFDLADATGAAEFDIAAALDFAIAEGAAAELDAYVYTGGADVDLDLVIGFEEKKDAGLADMLYATVDVELLDVIAALAWNVDVAGGYDTGDIDPYFGVGYGSDSVLDLNVGVNLKAGLTGIDNTTITLDYTSVDLATDNGKVALTAKVTY